MIVCFSSQECHSQSSLDQIHRKSEWKYSAIKYTVGIQANAHLKQSPKKKNQFFTWNIPHCCLEWGWTKVHTKNELNSKYTQGKSKLLGGGL